MNKFIPKAYQKEKKIAILHQKAINDIKKTKKYIEKGDKK